MRRINGVDGTRSLTRTEGRDATGKIEHGAKIREDATERYTLIIALVVLARLGAIPRMLTLVTQSASCVNMGYESHLHHSALVAMIIVFLES